VRAVLGKRVGEVIKKHAGDVTPLRGLSSMPRSCWICWIPRGYGYGPEGRESESLRARHFHTGPINRTWDPLGKALPQSRHISFQKPLRYWEKFPLGSPFHTTITNSPAYFRLLLAYAWALLRHTAEKQRNQKWRTL